MTYSNRAGPGNATRKLLRSPFIVEDLSEPGMEGLWVASPLRFHSIYRRNGKAFVKQRASA